MLIHSDNTASDLLIKKVGLAQINENLKEWGATGFQEITTLSDVRRLAYSGIHPNAVHLLNRDIRALKNVKNQEARVTKLASILNLRMQDLRTKNLDAAYSAYYGKQLNSATLRAYGDLLEKMSEGGRLSPSSDKFLIETMERAETGKQRVIAGFPAGYVFAHKTGTQHARVCDLGIMRKVEGDKRVVIAACTRNIASLTKAEHVLKSVGEAVYKSGLFKAGL
jgi:beta-lactamase class A